MSFVPGFEIISEIVFTLYLVCAAYQDYRERLVIRGTHLLGLSAVGIYCLSAADSLYGAWGARTVVLLVSLLCEGGCGHFSFYGPADSLVFLNCMLYYWLRTDAFAAFFLFWWMKAFSGIIFLAAQLLKHHRLSWRLDEPAAYIPSILCAFALTNTVLKGYNM